MKSTGRRQSTARSWTWGLSAIFLLLLTACAARIQDPGLRSVVSKEQERAHAAELQRKAKRFRWDQHTRLDTILMRLLLSMPNPPHVTANVVESDAVNAVVDGEGRIGVPLGMLRFVKSDDELAVVLGHELGHLPTSRAHGLVTWTLGYHEREADIRGLVYAHRAGYDIRMGARVFERMATELAVPPWDTDVGPHPSHAERIILAGKIADLLEGKSTGPDADVLVKQLPSLLGLSTDLP
ncbi:MAG: M48 family metallopeptidase [Candidatus Methylomirabilales bacterium]